MINCYLLKIYNLKLKIILDYSNIPYNTITEMKKKLCEDPLAFSIFYISIKIIIYYNLEITDVTGKGSADKNNIVGNVYLNFK